MIRVSGRFAYHLLIDATTRNTKRISQLLYAKSVLSTGWSRSPLCRLSFGAYPHSIESNRVIGLDKHSLTLIVDKLTLHV